MCEGDCKDIIVDVLYILFSYVYMRFHPPGSDWCISLVIPVRVQKDRLKTYLICHLTILNLRIPHACGIQSFIAARRCLAGTGIMIYEIYSEKELGRGLQER